MERRVFLKLTAALIAAGIAPAVAFPALPAPGAAPLAIFLFDDCDYVAAPSRALAIDWYADYVGIPVAELEVEEVALHKTMIWGDSLDDESVTFAEAIRRHHAAGAKFPEIVASTEF